MKLINRGSILLTEDKVLIVNFINIPFYAKDYHFLQQVFGL